MKKVFVIIGILVFSGIALCEELSLPNYIGYVNDYASILSSETAYQLTRLSDEIERKTTAQLAIVTIDTVSPLGIENYAVRLFEKWGIGQKGKDNGVLLLVAVKDRAVRIEVGYGLEGAIPDILAKQIIENSIIPFFKNGDYNAGVLKGAVALSRLIAKEYNVDISMLDNFSSDASVPEKSSDFFTFLFIIFIIIIIFGLRTGFFWWWFFPHGSYKRRHGYWHGTGFGGSSGGFSGGFGGFGGGFSGGGGASGRW